MGIDIIQSLKSNALVLLEQIRENAPISKRELQDVTGFSWGLISRLTNELANEGYIVSKGKVSTGVGRKPDEFDINPERNYFIGVDFSTNGMLTVLTDLKGRIIEQSQEKWKKREKMAVLEQIYTVLDDIVERYAEHNIMGIGFAAQGVVNVAKGIYVYVSGIEGWNDVPLKTLVEERYGVDVVIAHDPDCLMRCECAFGVLKGSAETEVVMIHFTPGGGIGMSIMINGQIYLGHHGKAGEIGHIIVGQLEEGKYDFLDNHILGKDLEKEYQKLTGNKENVAYDVIVERARKGDIICNDVIRRCYRYISQSIAIVNSLLNPEVIVVHAVSCEDDEVFMDIVDEHLRNVSYDKSVKLRLSNLKNEAKAVGASLVVIEKVMNDLL